MNPRRLSAWGFVVLVIAMAILSYLGNPAFFYVYVGLLTPFVLFHALFVCARCSNIYCAFNSKSPDFIFRLNSRPANQELAYSDLRTVWAAIPLVLILMIPLIAIWQLSPYAFFALLISAAVLFAIYQKETCYFCTNNCPNNKNTAYREWKKQNRDQTSS